MKTSLRLLFNNRIKIFNSIIFFITFISSAYGEIHSSTYKTNCGINCSHKNRIKSENGKLYAYTSLLFNKNHHFVNQIEANTIPDNENDKDNYNIHWFKKYSESIKSDEIKKIAENALILYNNPTSFTTDQLKDLEKKYSNKNIIIKFTINQNSSSISLEYCIFGEKVEILVKHPFLISKIKIYNIKPFTSYNDLSTSNSTFYSNMMYINTDEVNNDSLVAIAVISGKNERNHYFVGSKISDDIKYCLKEAVKKPANARKMFWKMFVIHELTHKILKKKFKLNLYDQAIEEELSLSSTIYDNPYLGLSVLYAYLNYNPINPHRIAAENYIKFLAKKTNNKDLILKPSQIKFLQKSYLKKLAKEHFFKIFNNLKNQKKNKPFKILNQNYINN